MIGNFDGCFITIVNEDNFFLTKPENCCINFNLYCIAIFSYNVFMNCSIVNYYNGSVGFLIFDLYG